MSDQTGISGICGLCCITLFSAFEPWFNTKRFGGNCCAGCCGGPRGCCSCFDGGFNKDSWDEEDAQRKRDQAQKKKAGEGEGNKDTSTKPDVVADQQPERVPEMDSGTDPTLGGVAV